jgi:hypothetical protein
MIREYNCFTCGKKVYRSDAMIKAKRNQHIFCSSKCNYTYRKGKIVSPTQFLFQKGQTPWNKGKNWNEMYGKEKAEKLRKIQSEKKKRDWETLNFREKSMKSRVPEKLINFRKGGEKVRKKKWFIEKLKSIPHKRHVLEVLMNGNNKD